MSKRFVNIDPSVKGRKNLFSALKWQLRGGAKKWPKKVHNSHTPQLAETIADNEVAITYINHSTFLLQLKDSTILTDPIFSQRAGPLSLIGPKRVRPPGISLQALPKIDLVLISHNHYDHMDIPSIRALWKRDKPLFIVPLGNGHILQSQGISNVIELTWWQEHALGNERILLTPAQHWSGRGIFDHCKALWGGYLIISHNLKILFAGDSGYNTHFQEIYKKYGSIDVSLLPIGAYEPRWFMREHHMNPQEAVQAHLDLGSCLSVGTHFGTFRLTNEGIDDPVVDLKKSLKSHSLDEKAFVTLEHGQTVWYRKKEHA